MRLRSALLFVCTGYAIAAIEVGFCNSDGSGFLLQQPAEHMERWSLPYSNGSHLVIDWRPDRRVCGRNVSSYYVDVQTTRGWLNFFISTFGSFPQDVCAPGGSQARNAVDVEEESPGGTCTPYPWNAFASSRRMSFAIPAALRTLTNLDVAVTVRAYGSHSPIGDPERRTDVLWWCHKYRRKKVAVGQIDPTRQPFMRRIAQRASGAVKKLAQHTSALVFSRLRCKVPSKAFSF
mmetsp:Transcript_28414/g.62217  ORF Transcript_28414/g.62217 Transcript_28414/m.62217 type:complete len:234 (+) Transcript_28414:267-968(+)|eukprot:6185244-Pleurochrysis_carterae.AAC.3